MQDIYRIVFYMKIYYRENKNTTLFYKKIIHFAPLFCFWIIQICGVLWSDEEVICRFPEEFWRNRGKNTEVILEGKEWEVSYEKNRKVLLFFTASNIDLGMYQIVHIYVSSKVGKEIKWGWSSEKWGSDVYFPSEGVNLINDGKSHVYSFPIRFPDRNNPIFDKVERLYVQTGEVEDTNDVVLEKIVFVPYNRLHPKQVTIGSVCMDVLWNDKVSFKRKITQGMQLVFYTGIYNPVIGAYQKKSKDEDWQTDGVSFSIDVVSDSKAERIFFTEMKPKTNPEDRNWKKWELNLLNYNGKEVEIVLNMNSGGTAIGDFGIWGNPMIIISPDTSNIEKIPIFIISCDTLRPDHLLPYGYELPTSPHLDIFARDAVVFENAYTTQTFTPVAHMSLLTGRYPEGHGLTRNTDVYPYIKTLPEIMREYGYVTAGFAGFLWWFIPSRGFARGMDLFSVPEEGREGNRRTVIEVCNEAKEWISNNKTQNIFVFMHNYDVHSKAYGDLIYDAEEDQFKMFSRGLVRPEKGYTGCDYIPTGGLLLQYLDSQDIFPTEEEITYIRALYDDCVYKVDYALGDFFAFLKEKGLYNPAFIAVVSDHGESLGEHGLYGHDNVYEESMRNVTIVKFPNNEYAGLRVKERVILEDIMPTVLGIINQRLDLLLDGISLRDIISRGETKRRNIFSSSLRGDMRAVIKEQYKLLEDIPRGTKFLFDLQKNGVEYYDVSSKYPEISSDLSELLSQKFSLKKEGWWLCFSSPFTFWTGSMNIQCSAPILFTRIQGGVLRTKNERTTPMELKADIFLPKSSVPAIIQIVPVEDNSELKVHIQNCPLLKYPPNYDVLSSSNEKFFYFSSEAVKANLIDNIDNLKNQNEFFFWVEYYSKGKSDERKVVDISEQTQEALKNLGYLD